MSKIDRRTFLNVMGKGAAALALPFISCGSRTSQNGLGEKPNIVFIFIDDLGWKDLGAYGSEVYETPNIDQLAKDGMRFTDAYAAAAVCSPTRASLYTGKYPATVKITDYLPGRTSRDFEPLRAPEDLDHLPHEEITMAEVLRDNGYHTHFIGKWHLGGEGSLPTDHGFMTNVAGCHMGNPGRDGFFSPYNIPNLEPREENEYLTERLTDDALSVLENAGDDPFFLMMSYYTVHRPLQAPDDRISDYESKMEEHEYTNPEFVVEQNPDMPSYDETTWEEKQEWGEKESLFEQDGFNDLRLTRVKRRQNQPVFGAMVDYLDFSVGRILDKLQSLNLEENTIVIFYSDNGGLASYYPGAATSEAPLRAGKGWLYEGGIRVPLIVRWPGKVPANTENGSLISSPDFYPTLLEMAGIESDSAQEIEGMSFWSALSDQEELTDRTLYWHWPHYSNHGQQSPGGAIREGDYKLIEYYENNTRQLFNLREDVEEMNDLVEQEPETAERLTQKLHEWRERIDAQMPVPNPDYTG